MYIYTLPKVDRKLHYQQICSHLEHRLAGQSISPKGKGQGHNSLQTLTLLLGLTAWGHQPKQSAQDKKI